MAQKKNLPDLLSMTVNLPDLFTLTAVEAVKDTSLNLTSTVWAPWAGESVKTAVNREKSITLSVIYVPGPVAT